jgi:hypothetical protein
VSLWRLSAEALTALGLRISRSACYLYLSPEVRELDLQRSRDRARKQRESAAYLARNREHVRAYQTAYARLARRPTSLTRAFLEPIYGSRDPPLVSLDELVTAIRDVAQQEFQPPTIERALRKAAVYYRARAPPYLVEHPPNSGTWWYAHEPPPATPREPEP